MSALSTVTLIKAHRMPKGARHDNVQERCAESCRRENVRSVVVRFSFTTIGLLCGPLSYLR